MASGHGTAPLKQVGHMAAPGNARTDTTRPQDGSDYPQEQDGALAGRSTAQRPEAA